MSIHSITDVKEMQFTVQHDFVKMMSFFDFMQNLAEAASCLLQD